MAGMVIVGAGECGTRAALTLRQAGWDGAVTLIGAEPEIPYERPPLSKPAEGVPAPTPIATREQLAGAGIDYRCGVAVTGIERATRRLALSDGGTLGYRGLLLATGARPRALPAAPPPAQTYRTLADARALLGARLTGRRVVLIGAGLIGLELAAVMRARGAEVVVLEAGERALGRAVLPELAEAIVERHRAAGVRLHFGVTVARAEAGGVRLGDGRHIAADAVIVAIGVLPNAELAAAAGLAVADGIAVDPMLRTADPAIFAAGDCAAVWYPFYRTRLRFECWRNAQDQGIAAARSMLGGGEPFDRLPWFWSDQYELGLQVVGRADPALRTVRRDLGGAACVLFSVAGDGRLAAASGLGPGTAVAKEVRLAERLIEAGIRPDPAALADPSANLKSLLRARRAA